MGRTCVTLSTTNFKQSNYLVVKMLIINYSDRFRNLFVEVARHFSKTLVSSFLYDLVLI